MKSQPYFAWSSLVALIFTALTLRALFFDTICKLVGHSYQVGFGLHQGIEVVFWTVLSVIAWTVARDLKGL